MTLDRSPANCLEPTVTAELHAVLDAVERSSARAVICQSAGGPMFCAGADIGFVAGCMDDGPEGKRRMLDFVGSLQALFARIEALPIPTIAAIDGTAVGGGFELALACDVRIVGASVRVGLPEVNVGLIPGAGGTQRLTRLVGRGVATELIFGGDLLTGDEACARGLVQQAVEVESVRQTAHDLAVSLAGQPRNALASAKRCIALADSAEGYETELRSTGELLNDSETIDLIRKFLAARSRSYST